MPEAPRPDGFCDSTPPQRERPRCSWGHLLLASRGHEPMGLFLLHPSSAFRELNGSIHRLQGLTTQQDALDLDDGSYCSCIQSSLAPKDATCGLASNKFAYLPPACGVVRQ